MSTSFMITCPKCTHEFQAEDAFKKHLDHELQKETKRLASEYQQKNSALEAEKEELEKKEKNIDLLVNQALKEKESALKAELSQELDKQYKESLDAYRKKVNLQEEQLKELRRKEIEIEDLKGKLADQEQEMELKFKRQMNERVAEERTKIQESLQEETQLKLREKEELLAGQRKQIEEMKRKIEQGSMQLQGEVQELVIEERLRDLFPFDQISEVGKGVRGADVLQAVMSDGVFCGSLIYESKNTQAYNSEWVDKLRKDQLAAGAQTAILVTKNMPQNFKGDYFIEKNVVVCSVRLFPVVAALCRTKLIELKHQASRFDLQKDTMGLLYQYLTGEEFRMHLEETVSGIIGLKEQIATERRAFEKQWKERDKQADRMISNLSQMFGSLKGIAGSSIKEIKSLELV